MSDVLCARRFALAFEASKSYNDVVKEKNIEYAAIVD